MQTKYKAANGNAKQLLTNSKLVNERKKSMKKKIEK